MEENRKTVDYTPIKNDEIKKLIFKLKKGNEKKEDNMYFLMEKSRRHSGQILPVFLVWSPIIP